MKLDRILSIASFALLFLLAFPQREAKAQEVVELTEEQFARQVYDYRSGGPWHYLGTKPAVVDFYTTWCGYCKALKPRLKRLARTYGDRIIVYSVDCEAAADLALALRINAYPALLFIPMEGIPTMSFGALPEEQLRKQVESLLLSPRPEPEE